MRVAMVANAAATHTQRWARAMVGCGHELRLFSVRDHPIEGVEVVAYLRTGSTNPSRAALAAGYTRLRYRLARGLDDFDPDLVHAHYASTNGYIAALTTSKPTILTVWGTDVVAKPGRALSPTHRHRARRAIESASVVTSASEFMAEHVAAIVPGTVVRIVPFGVDTSLFAPKPLPNNRDLLVAKSLEPRYGIGIVIKAMDKVIESVPGATLTIAGDGSLRGDLERLAADSTADIRFLGKVDHDELPARMAAAAAVINPTIVEESFGVVVLEAQAVGRPVVSTRVGAIPSVCIEEQTAVLVPPRDVDAMAQAIIDVLQGRRLRDAVSIGPRFVRDGFTWQESVATMNRLYTVIADA
jgi:glycosyltransferase involved in cell wall biosynthesis